LSQIAETTSTEIPAAVASAQNAQKLWRRKHALERAESIYKIANALLAMEPNLGRPHPHYQF